MEENKSGLYIVAIVGIIAVVALVIMVMGAGKQLALSSAEDASGNVKAVASFQTGCEKQCGVAGIYQENPCICKNPTA